MGPLVAVGTCFRRLGNESEFVWMAAPKQHEPQHELEGQAEDESQTT